MSAPPFIPLYVGDYFRDTHHLSRDEHGAYLLLLMAMWSAGGRLPSTDERLARLAHCTPEEWASIRATILAFFTRRGGHIRSKRMDKELKKYRDKSVAGQKGGKSSASKKMKENNAISPISLQAKSNEPEPEPQEVIAPTEQITSERDAPILPDGGKSALALVVDNPEQTLEEKRAWIAEQMAPFHIRRAH